MSENVFTELKNVDCFILYCKYRVEDLLERIEFRANPDFSKLHDAYGKPIDEAQLRMHPTWKVYFTKNRPCLDVDDLKLIERIKKKLSDGVVVNLTDVTLLESVYCNLSPYAKLDGDMESRLWQYVRQAAVKDFEQGKFSSIDHALQHYGMPKHERLSDAK